MSKKKKSSFKMIVVIIGLTLIAKVIGLLRDAFMGQALGAGFETDTYVQGISLTTLIFLGIGSGISTNLIPLIVRYKKEESNSKSISRIISLLFVMIALFGGLYFIGAPLVTQLFSKGFTQEKLIQTTLLVRVMIPTLIFISVQYFMVGVLQANEKFILPAIASLPFNILFFVYLGLSVERYGVLGLAVITSVGWFLQMMMLLPSVLKQGLIPVFKWDLNLRDKEVQKFFLGIIPIIVVTLTHQFNILLDNMAASKFEDGRLAAIYFGNLMFTAVVTTTVYGITAVMFPKFNHKYLEDNKDGLFQSVVNVLRSIVLLLVPMSVGMILVGPHIISLVFERGMFDQGDTMTTVVAFTGYTSFMLAFGFIDVLNKAYYTIGNRKIPLMISGLIIGINIIANRILVGLLGFAGISIATSIAFYIGAFISFLLFRRMNKAFSLSRFMNTLLKTIVAAVAMGIGVYVANMLVLKYIEAQGIGLLVIMGVDILVGIIVYAVTLLIVKEQLVTHAVSQFILKVRGAKK